MAIEAVLGILIGSGLGLIAMFLRPRARPAPLPEIPVEEPLFLVRGTRVVDATEAGRAILGDHADADWPALVRALRPIFPDMPDTPPDGPLRLASKTAIDPGLTLAPLEDTIRIGLAGQPPRLSTALTAERIRQHRTRLSSVTALAPYPIWQTGPRGEILWSNDRYRSLAGFAGRDTIFAFSPPERGQVRRDRLRVGACHPDLPEWFEVTSVRADDSWYHYAVEIDAVVEAEVAQRNFVQTLAKTFAHLPIGLAIFDRNRQLVLFNPALVDLTELSVEFLSARPNLMSFFDQLRDNRVMPEPKSYDGWRQQLAELVAAATDDRYSETWSLPNGLTYRVTGRPHPDGAVAFLIEDISSEISLTRRFRSELELSHAVIDTLGEAVAVFNATATLTYCNAGYRTLWKSDPDSAFADVTVIDATSLWQARAQPSPVWGDIRDFAFSYGQRAGWQDTVRLLDGRILHLRCDPLPGGATLVRFADLPLGDVGPANPAPALSA